MITYKDFAPQMLDSGGFLRAAEFESFADALAAMNAWLAAHQPDVVNVETVVLPNVHSPHEEGTTDTSLRTSGDMGTHWHQFIRVWYRSPN